MMTKDLRLIEAGFPCHQVGAETQRERGASSALPPLYFLHVWWARRPLTPSRAAVLASLVPAGMSPDTFLRQLGIERKEVMVQGQPWVIPDTLLEKLEVSSGKEVLPVTKSVVKALEVEQQRRLKNLELMQNLLGKHPDLPSNSTFIRWRSECQPLPYINLIEEELLPVRTVMGDPAWAKERIAFEKAYKIRTGEDKYLYGRAYAAEKPYSRDGLVVLDPTSGGGSIPFEAMRLGHTVIANELNPVATTILHATLNFPARYGQSLKEDISFWGGKLLEGMRNIVEACFPPSLVPQNEIKGTEKVLLKLGTEGELFRTEILDGFLYARQVTCPHCGGEAPLLNTFWLSKEENDTWGVRVMTNGEPKNGKVHFEMYRVKDSCGPNGEDPNGYTVSDGVGQCVHCKQAIEGDEIKAQARGESQYGTWIDRLYCVVALRKQPKLDKNGNIQRFLTGVRAGELKTEKMRYFRAPNERDFHGLQLAEKKLKDNWTRWEEADLIPTESYPGGHSDRVKIYGVKRWCELFTPRQILGHILLLEGLNQLIPELQAKHGKERAKAIGTYLQFFIDKGLDYNSKQTRWEFTRGVIKGTFSRHDYSIKWTFGEMIFSGAKSGAAWALSQVLDAYTGIAELVEPVHRLANDKLPMTIINGSAASMPSIENESVDLVCMDPPYYDNVQYAELSDYFYVWMKRGLKDLYPELFGRRLTNKMDEAVANPAQEGSAAAGKAAYQERMANIFRECRRVLKQDGVMTMMFTHKQQNAWETLTRSLIESGWEITASFPVESEGENSLHQMDKASAASSIFITCRKRSLEARLPSTWTGLGGTGVANKVREAVKAALVDFEPLRLNPVDRMVASYGRALQVLSKSWPVVDGNEPVGPTRAMNEAARVVASQEISRITQGRLSVDDLDPESSMVLTLFGIFRLGSIAFDEANNVAKSLNIRMEAKVAGYRLEDGDRVIGYNQETAGRRGQTQAPDDTGFHSPLVRKGSKLRLALPEQRSSKRLHRPQSLWDVMQGALVKYAQGDIPVARAYLEAHAKGNLERVIDLLEVWSLECGKKELKKVADGLLFGLRLQAKTVIAA